MTKIDIFSGFLGAGKTTLIKKLIQEAYQGEKLVLIENEFGEIGIDGGFLQDAGIQITEMNSGCICCSLVGDFGKALRQVMEQYHPDRILIEPSGVGKLSDVIRAVQGLEMEEAVLNGFTTVADAGKCKMYMKNFGEFFNDQIEHASSIVLSRTAGMSQAKLEAVVALLREHNQTASIITTPWEQLTGAQILETMERKNTLQAELALLEEEAHHHHDHDDEECCCGHDHDHEHEHHDHDDEECCCGHDHDHEHEHHDHEHDEDCCCGHDHEHEHHDHEHDEDCCCGHDHDHHHHHHHADEVFTSWGVETTRQFTREEIEDILSQFTSGLYGAVLRAKGIVAGADGQWIHFDYVPGEENVRTGAASTIGRLCVIGSKIDEKALAALFQVK
ncbi:MAG: GTP-binding protein [Clostridiaceae bacterium]|nr:GTP-binding protein [Clostridiaceae bacterium]